MGLISTFAGGTTKWSRKRVDVSLAGYGNVIASMYLWNWNSQELWMLRFVDAWDSWTTFADNHIEPWDIWELSASTNKFRNKENTQKNAISFKSQFLAFPYELWCVFNWMGSYTPVLNVTVLFWDVDFHCGLVYQDIPAARFLIFELVMEVEEETY